MNLQLGQSGSRNTVDAQLAAAAQITTQAAGH